MVYNVICPSPPAVIFPVLHSQGCTRGDEGSRYGEHYRGACVPGGREGAYSLAGTCHTHCTGNPCSAEMLQATAGL